MLSNFHSNVFREKSMKNGVSGFLSPNLFLRLGFADERKIGPSQNGSGSTYARDLLFFFGSFLYIFQMFLHKSVDRVHLKKIWV